MLLEDLPVVSAAEMGLACIAEHGARSDRGKICLYLLSLDAFNIEVERICTAIHSRVIVLNSRRYADHLSLDVFGYNKKLLLTVTTVCESVERSAHCDVESRRSAQSRSRWRAALGCECEAVA